MSLPLLAVDTALTSLAETEHVLLGLGRQVLLPGDAVLCTHMVRDGEPHYAFTLVTADVDAIDQVAAYFAAWPTVVSQDQPAASSCFTPGLHLATTEAFARNGGRCVRFPGSTSVVGRPTVGSVLADTAIDRLEVLGGVTADDADLLHSRDFVRPLWRHGRLVLPVLPAGPGAVAPFEVPNPTPCCGEHGPVRAASARPTSA